MIKLRQQRGAALLIGIFLITVVVVFAAVVALTSSTQHLGQARAGLAEQAWYTAIGRLEEETQSIARGNGCANASEAANNFVLTVSCDGLQNITEGRQSYEIHTVSVSARQGSTGSAVFVRRSVRAQVWSET